MAVYSEKLEKARKYEVENSADIFNTEKPSFHITPPVGWINDPNGFSCYKGEYHLFYQYHPYSTHWGPMHWGHVKSKDLITWEQLPCALAPDEEYDGQGCFSGTAIQDGDRHVLIYTSVVDKEQQDGTHLIRQTQSIAVGDGENYEKLICNPVIKADCLPEGSSPVDFRDPKIWKEGDRFYAVVGSLAGGRQRTSLPCFRQIVWMTGDLKKFWMPAEMNMEKCGSVRISLSWTAGRY